MAFTSGQWGPDTFIDNAGNTVLIGATVTASGYVCTVDALGNLTITGPATDALTVTVTPATGAVYTATVQVKPLVAEIESKDAAVQAAAVQRANHTGTQAQSTVTNLVSDLAAKLDTASATATFELKGALARSGNPSLSATVDPDLFAAKPAAAALGLTSTAGGSDITHPSMVFDAAGFGADSNGKAWKFWMCATPYAGSDSAIENPTIYVADDPSIVGGTAGWQEPPGISNPVDPKPAGTNDYNSDPDLAFGPDGKLHLFWRAVLSSNGTEVVRHKSSEDGITWSATTDLITSTIATSRLLAPSVVWTGSRWLMFGMDITTSPYTLVRSENTSLNPAEGAWSAPEDMSYVPPTGRDAWHIDVNAWGGQLHMLVADCALGVAGGPGDLYLATSLDDGKTWTHAARPFLARTSTGWDRALYRSTMVPTITEDGRLGYHVLYSSQTPSWRIGYTLARVMVDPAPMGPLLYYTPQVTASTAQLVEARELAVPVYFSRRTRLDKLGQTITSAGSVGSVIRLGIREDNGYGQPGALILDAGTHAGTATSDAITVDVDVTVGPGVVWFTVTGQGAPVTQPTVRVAASMSGIPIGGDTPNIASANALVGYRRDGVAGALPATFTIGSRITNPARPHFRTAAS